MSEKDRKETVRIFNAQTGAFEEPRPDQKNLVEEHLAQVDEKVDHAPGDRTAEELASLEPAEAGPVLTGAQPGEPENSPFVADTAARAAARRGRG